MIVGIGHTAEALYNVCRGNRFFFDGCSLFLLVVMILNIYMLTKNILQKKKPIYKVKDIEKIIDQEKIDTVLLAIPEMSRDDLKNVIGRVQDKVKTVKYLPQVPGTINFDSTIEDFDGLLMISSATGIIKIPSRICKRLIDIIASLFGLLLLIPITILYILKIIVKG